MSGLRAFFSDLLSPTGPEDVNFTKMFSSSSESTASSTAGTSAPPVMEPPATGTSSADDAPQPPAPPTPTLASRAWSNFTDGLSATWNFTKNAGSAFFGLWYDVFASAFMLAAPFITLLNTFAKAALWTGVAAKGIYLMSLNVIPLAIAAAACKFFNAEDTAKRFAERAIAIADNNIKITSLALAGVALVGGVMAVTPAAGATLIVSTIPTIIRIVAANVATVWNKQVRDRLFGTAQAEGHSIATGVPGSSSTTDAFGSSPTSSSATSATPPVAQVNPQEVLAQNTRRAEFGGAMFGVAAASAAIGAMPGIFVSSVVGAAGSTVFSGCLDMHRARCDRLDREAAEAERLRGSQPPSVAAGAGPSADSPRP